MTFGEDSITNILSIIKQKFITKPKKGKKWQNKIADYYWNLPDDEKYKKEFMLTMKIKLCQKQ